MRVPDNIKKLIENDQVFFSWKAETLLENGYYEYEDFVNSILFGDVKKKEKDEKKQSKYKYTIIGPALDGQMIYSCGKIIERDDKHFYVITFHEAD